MRQTASLLDLGTGGGERLSELAPFPLLAVAVEDYRERLYRLYLHIKREGGFTTQGHQRLLEVRKPGKSMPSVKDEDNSP